MYFTGLEGPRRPRKAKPLRRVRTRGDEKPAFDPSQDSGISNNPFDPPKKSVPQAPKNTNGAKDLARLLVDTMRSIVFLNANAKAANAVQWDDSITDVTLRADLNERQKQHIKEAGAFVAGVISRGRNLSDLSRYDPDNHTMKDMILDSMGLIDGGEVIATGGTVIRSIGAMYNNARRLGEYCSQKGAQIQSLVDQPKAYIKDMGEGTQILISKLAAPIIAGTKFAAEELTPTRKALLMAALSLRQKSQGVYSAFTSIFGAPKVADPQEAQAKKNAEEYMRKFNAWLHPGGPVSQINTDQFHQRIDALAQAAASGGYITSGGTVDEERLFFPPPGTEKPLQTLPPPELNPTTFSGLFGADPALNAQDLQRGAPALLAGSAALFAAIMIWGLSPEKKKTKKRKKK